MNKDTFLDNAILCMLILCGFLFATVYFPLFLGWLHG